MSSQDVDCEGLLIKDLTFWGKKVIINIYENEWWEENMILERYKLFLPTFSCVFPISVKRYRHVFN